MISPNYPPLVRAPLEWDHVWTPPMTWITNDLDLTVCFCRGIESWPSVSSRRRWSSAFVGWLGCLPLTHSRPPIAVSRTPLTVKVWILKWLRQSMLFTFYKAAMAYYYLFACVSHLWQIQHFLFGNSTYIIYIYI